MAHYAFLDDNNIVSHVIVGRNEDEIVDGISDWEQHYAEIAGQRCVRTSYNARIRHKFASIGDTYDQDGDVFIAPQPYPSWSLDSNYDWVAPVPCPTEGYWTWDEAAGDWVEIPAGS